MSRVPLRFQVSKPLLAGREAEYVADAVETGWISGSGAYLDRLESAVSAFLGIEHGVAVTSGTAGLHLTCLSMGLKSGMDVIVPSLTYVASANAVTYCGARPVFADSALDTWNATIESIVRAWTEKTVGVIAVHLYGLPAPIADIAVLCKQRGAWLIEDCAESFGAKHNGRFVGSFGDAAVLSFFGNKIISTGEGGMIFVRDLDKRRLAVSLKGQGMDLESRYWHPIVGYNYRMTNVTAAIGLGQMEMAEYHINERRRVAASYLKALAPLQKEGLLRLPVEPNGYRNVYWLFSVVLNEGDRSYRNAVQTTLLEGHGVETRPFFVPMHRLPMYGSEHELPNAEFLGDHGINLPSYSGLKEEEIGEICAALAQTLKRVRTQ
ncbi:MAG: hypothetical protein A2289_22545 [Deltaproteobacteria bacterium RIFOXYA12_FULL_58_15]|nr:MAG: hypothetical protein A2289_22545 [Deltaproteobacteria bacterium RIFOXYA12_FULL_58_15]OGR15210.1 MAG: hypothetical protein A2341_08980 [Deltaproteobacteria bacterium RIFOXYB12_FULL_58_9]